MADSNNRESRKYNITDDGDMNNNYWINGLLSWWSGFSLRTKLLAIATLVVSLLMTGIIATSKGYPHEYKTGFHIKIGKIDSNDCQIFDSGTSLSENGKLLTDGGRVLSIVCQGKDFDTVFEKAYKNLKEIHFEGIYFRNDIGHQVRKNFSKEN